MILCASLYASDLCTATFCIDNGMVDTTVWLLGWNLCSNFDDNADGDAEDDACELGINSTSFCIRLGSEHKAV